MFICIVKRKRFSRIINVWIRIEIGEDQKWTKIVAIKFKFICENIDQFSIEKIQVVMIIFWERNKYLKGTDKEWYFVAFGK